VRPVHLWDRGTEGFGPGSGVSQRFGCSGTIFTWTCGRRLLDRLHLMKVLFV
jgi:hypothetical protein